MYIAAGFHCLPIIPACFGFNSFSVCNRNMFSFTVWMTLSSRHIRFTRVSQVLHSELFGSTNAVRTWTGLMDWWSSEFTGCFAAKSSMLGKDQRNTYLSRIITGISSIFNVISYNLEHNKATKSISHFSNYINSTTGLN